MSVWSLTYRQSVFKRYHSGRHFSEFLPTKRRQKSVGIDMEQITSLSPYIYIYRWIKGIPHKDQIPSDGPDQTSRRPGSPTLVTYKSADFVWSGPVGSGPCSGIWHWDTIGSIDARNVRRILVRGVNAPLPPEANKILKVWLRNGAFWSISE